MNGQAGPGNRSRFFTGKYGVRKLYIPWQWLLLKIIVYTIYGTRGKLSKYYKKYEKIG